VHVDPWDAEGKGDFKTAMRLKAQQLTAHRVRAVDLMWPSRPPRTSCCRRSSGSSWPCCPGR
jgi:hypothetical protein